MRRFTVFITILLLLTACAAPAQPTIFPTETGIWKKNTPVLDGTFATSLLVSEWRGSTEGHVLFPLDPASGKALSDYPPLALGRIFFSALSPDRQTLAAVSFPKDTAVDGALLLIDLQSWKVTRFELGLRGWVNTMVFDADGRQLAIAHGESRYTLTMIDVEKGTVRVQSQIDAPVSLLKFTETGDGLMLYRAMSDPSNWLVPLPPQALLLDASDLTPRWSVDLKEVHDGIFPKDETVTKDTVYQPGQASYITPGLAFAPDRDALYVVHADSEKLTTVDFESGTVKTVDIEPKLTWFERLLSLTAGVAHAKIGDGISRQAVVSADGQFLYMVGVNSATFQDENGNWHMEQTPLGLQILQTNDGSRTEQIEADATDVSLSPDGRFLYLRNWGNSNDNIPWTDILDLSSGQIITRKTGVSGMPALLMNGEFVMVSTYSTGEFTHHMSILTPDGAEVLAEWIATTYTWWMTTSY